MPTNWTYAFSEFIIIPYDRKFGSASQAKEKKILKGNICLLYLPRKVKDSLVFF